MTTNTSDISIFLIRPIDCSAKILNAIRDLLLSQANVPHKYFQQGLFGAEQFVVAISKEKTLVATACLKYQHTTYHKYLFTQAGVPQMYNPDSLESAWVCVHPDFRGQGIWNRMHDMRASYLGNRPYHSTHRVSNDIVVKRTERRDGYIQAGQDFQSVTSEHELRLVVANHDPVYNPETCIIYGARVPTRIRK